MTTSVYIIAKGKEGKITKTVYHVVTCERHYIKLVLKIRNLCSKEFVRH